jgi:hypothetical protein
MLAQGNAPICDKFPDKNQGYFIFNKESYPNVDTWFISIQENSNLENEFGWKEVQIMKTTESFYRLPIEYMMPKVATKAVIKGYLSNGQVIGEVVWLINPEVINTKFIDKIRCVGKTYVWELHVYDKIDENGESTGQGAFQFTSGGGEMNSAGVYYRSLRGLRASQTLSWLSNYDQYDESSIFSPKHHGYNYWVYGQGYNTQGVRNSGKYFQMNNILHNDNIRDDVGNLIVGNSYVVEKITGFWKDKDGDWFETTGDGSHYLSQYGTNPTSVGWLNLINQKLGIECACNPIPSSGSGQPNIGGGYSGSWLEWLEKLKKAVQKKNTNTWAKPNEPIFSMLESIRDDMEQEDGYEHDNVVPWWPANAVSHLMIFPISVDSTESTLEPILQISKHLVVNEDGSINSYSLELEPGLYSIKMFIEDYGLMDVFFEVNEYSIQSYPISNYLNVEIFPVPIAANETLTVKAKSNFTMKYTYYLTDDTGKQLSKKEVYSKPKESVEFKFDSNNLPDGQLFHKFVFEDGSETVYQSIKM